MALLHGSPPPRTGDAVTSAQAAGPRDTAALRWSLGKAPVPSSHVQMSLRERVNPQAGRSLLHGDAFSSRVFSAWFVEKKLCLRF